MALNVLIVSQLGKKIALKVIPSISFLPVVNVIVVVAYSIWCEQPFSLCEANANVLLNVDRINLADMHIQKFYFP